MVKPQRIVVGVNTDGSTDDAACVGIELAQRFGAALELVHAVPTDAAVDTARRAIRARLEASLPGAMLPYVTSEHHVLVLPGLQGPVLLERAGLPEAGLLVLGGHRRRGLLDLRSTAQYVLSRATCPVWIQSGPVKPVKRILVPVDISEESLLALGRACTWAREFGAHVTALSCFETPEFTYMSDVPTSGPTYVVDRLRDDARERYTQAMAGHDWKGVSHDVIFEESHPVTAILARQDGADLIMLGTHGRTGLSAVLLGSVASAVVREAHVPVVTIRTGSRSWLMPD